MKTAPAPTLPATCETGPIRALRSTAALAPRALDRPQSAWADLLVRIMVWVAAALATWPGQAAAVSDALRTLESARAELAQIGDVLSSEWLMGRRVYARNGELAADVSDLIVGDGGRLTAVVVHSRGSRGAPGGLFKIPWDQVELTTDYAQLLVPLSRYNAATYRLRRSVLAANERRLSMMRSSRIALSGGEPDGTVADILLSPAGELKAVLVEPFGGDARYAYPYRHSEYREGVYTLPYDSLALQRVALPEAALLDIVPAVPPDDIGGSRRRAAGGQLRYDSSFPFW
jgi:hypothetical protein